MPAFEAAVDAPRDWKPVYKRNNKSNKHKNLACFPRCSPAGHLAHTFCGGTVDVTFAASVDTTNLVVVGGFGVAFEPRWILGDVVEDAEVQGLVTQGDAPVLLRATAKSPLCFSFARHGSGWSYNCPMNSLDHTFHIYILAPISEQRPSAWRVVNVISSPRFKIVSHRRASAAAAASTASGVTAGPSTSVTPAKSPATSSLNALRNDGNGEDEDDLEDEKLAQSRPVHEPFIIVEQLAQEASARRKRAAVTPRTYASFMQHLPTELELCLSEMLRGFSLLSPFQSNSTNATASTSSAMGFRPVDSVDAIEAMLPIGVNLRLLSKPRPFEVGDEIPDMAGTYELSDEVLLSDLDMFGLNWLSKWAATRLLRRAVAPTDRFVTGWQCDWNAYELKLPENLISFTSSPVRFYADAEFRQFKVRGPMNSTMLLELQNWTVGPVIVTRFAYPNENGEISTRVDRCLWKLDDGSLSLLFLYQSVGGRGWGGTVFDHGLALLSDDEWVINKCTMGEMRRLH